MEKTYTLFTDTSHYVYSGAHTQVVESPEDLRPIANTSGTFLDMQQRWSATEKEVFSIYKFILEFDLKPKSGKMCTMLQSQTIRAIFA